MQSRSFTRAEGLLNPDLVWTRNTLEKADSEGLPLPCMESWFDLLLGFMAGTWVFEQLSIEEGIQCSLDYPPVKCNIW